MINRVTNYPDPIRRLVSIHFNRTHAKALQIFYCDTIKELNAMTKEFDLSSNIVKDSTSSSIKNITIYKVSYGLVKVSLVNKNNQVIQGDLNEFRIYYTKIRGIKHA